MCYAIGFKKLLSNSTTVLICHQLMAIVGKQISNMFITGLRQTIMKSVLKSADSSAKSSAGQVLVVGTGL